jgi:hypothetical protein
MSTEPGVVHFVQEPLMPRTVRFPLLLLFMVFVASCSDTRDAMAPDTQASASSMTRLGTDAMAASHYGDGDDEDVLPHDLSAIARYRSASVQHGAQTVSAVIGPQGGSLRLGDFEMIVPAGAVTSATRFSIMTFPENNRKKHAAASFLPHRTFNKAITLRVPLNSTQSAGDTGAHVMWWNGNAWTPLPTTPTSDGRLETKTMHFSMYGTQFRGFTLVGG